MTQVFCICTCVLYLYLWSLLWAKTSGLFSVVVQLVGKRWVSVVWIDYTGICHHSRPGASDRAACVLFISFCGFVFVCISYLCILYLWNDKWLHRYMPPVTVKLVYLCICVCIFIYIYLHMFIFWINYTSICNCLEFWQWTKPSDRAVLYFFFAIFCLFVNVFSVICHQ